MGGAADLEYHSPNVETRQALDELQRYLSDQLAPLMVADSISLLLERPPELVALQIQTWTAYQYRGAGRAVPISNYLFHALKKIQVMGEFRLVPQEQLQEYLADLCKIVLEHCPGEERDLLRQNLELLGQEEAISSSVEILHQPSGAAPPAHGSTPISALSEEAARGLRRFSLLLEQLLRLPMDAPAASSGDASGSGQAVAASGQATSAPGQPVGGGPSGAAAQPGPSAPGGPAVGVPVFAVGSSGFQAPQSGELLTQILTTAAVSAKTGTELDAYLTRLRERGVEAEPAQVMRALARSLPGWGVIAPGDGQMVAAVPSQPGHGPLDAMHRIVSLSKSPEEGARRFSEMVNAAIEQFNDGALAPAVAMFDLADRILAENRINAAIARVIIQRADETLSTERLAKYAEKPEKHSLLRRVLSFFPGLTPRGLLDTLENEPRRDRRKLLLALLEVHGPAGRAAAYEDLKASMAGVKDMRPWHQRNLVYLLRRIPRPPGEAWDEEVDHVIRLTARDISPIVRKEALATLGQIKHERAEQALIARLHEFEDLLSRPVPATVERAELLVLLDRTVHALARLGTSNTRRAVVDHGLKASPQLGDPTGRLVTLSGIDLSEDRELVSRLVAALRDELPVRVLGFVVQKKHPKALHLIKALSGTPAAAVRHALDEVVKRFPNQEFAEAAAKALAGFGATVQSLEATTTLSGDLELFGLPNLLQSLAESRVTGALTLLNPDGESVGVFNLEGGCFRDCHAGSLRGEEAVYQLFEKPTPGTFLLRSRRDGSSDPESSAPPREVFPIILEAVRRHDEYRKARALVPDDVALKATGSKPTKTDDEADVRFLRVLWAKATSGATAADCEQQIVADSYRIRSLLAHWVEEGSLQPQPR